MGLTPEPGDRGSLQLPAPILGSLINTVLLLAEFLLVASWPPRSSDSTSYITVYKNHLFFSTQPPITGGRSWQRLLDVCVGWYTLALVARTCTHRAGYNWPTYHRTPGTFQSTASSEVSRARMPSSRGPQHWQEQQVQKHECLPPKSPPRLTLPIM